MPILRLPEKWLYFAHVPKCAGSAVEDYLAERFGPLGLLERHYARLPGDAVWSVNPPQHMPEVVRQSLLPDSLFDAMFAVVRHPAHRLRSVFHYLREVENALRPMMTFGDWLSDLPRVRELEPGAWNGHLRPMHALVPEGATLFRLEDGFAPLIDWLDAQAGDTDGPREVAVTNARALRQEKANKPKPLVRLTRAHLTEIKRLYADDYARFGYDLFPQKDTA